MDSSNLLTKALIEALHHALDGFLVIVCFGSGVDSTAVLVALRIAGITPDLITFANTGAEKPETIAHLHRMNNVLAAWGWPLIVICKKVPLATTGYVDLHGECLANETLPSLAFGMKSCSIKWKQGPQDQFIKGVKSGPNARPPHPIWNTYLETGRKLIKLIGYDCGKADIRRSKKFSSGDADFNFAYPLQIIGWSRPDCVEAITQVLGADMVPIKSACFFCPASKPWELFWLAAHHPEQLDEALTVEHKALTGRHSRLDEVEFGEAWDETVRNADRFPSSNTTVGLGRSFAWNQWAWLNDVVDGNFVVRRTTADRARFVMMAAMLRASGEDNALDSRGAAAKKVIRIEVAQPELA